MPTSRGDMTSRYNLFKKGNKREEKPLQGQVDAGGNVMAARGTASPFRGDVPNTTRAPSPPTVTSSPRTVVRHEESNYKDSDDDQVKMVIAKAKTSSMRQSKLRSGQKRSRKRTRKNDPFPQKLFRILEEAKERGEDDIVAFLPHGKTFAVHDISRFVDEIMPRHFTTARFSSFLRQLNFYGFRRVSEPDGSFSYYHELFHKENKGDCLRIKRNKKDYGEEEPMEIDSVAQNPDKSLQQDKETQKEDTATKPTLSSLLAGANGRLRPSTHHLPGLTLEERIRRQLLQQDQQGVDLLLSGAGRPSLLGASASGTGSVLDQLLLRTTIPHMATTNSAGLLAGASPAVLGGFCPLLEQSMLGGVVASTAEVSDTTAALVATEQSLRTLQSLQLSRLVEHERQTTLSALVEAKDTIELLLAASMPPSAAELGGRTVDDPVAVPVRSAPISEDHRRSRKRVAPDAPDPVRSC